MKLYYYLISPNADGIDEGFFVDLFDNLNPPLIGDRVIYWSVLDNLYHYGYYDGQDVLGANCVITPGSQRMSLASNYIYPIYQRVKYPNTYPFSNGFKYDAAEIDSYIAPPPPPPPPQPKEVLEIVEIMKKHGEFWKDDCGVCHCDDIDMFEFAKEIYNTYLNKNQNEKDDKVSVNSESSEQLEVESFDQIVKKRKASDPHYHLKDFIDRARARAERGIIG